MGLLETKSMCRFGVGKSPLLNIAQKDNWFNYNFSQWNDLLIQIKKSPWIPSVEPIDPYNCTKVFGNCGKHNQYDFTGSAEVYLGSNEMFSTF